MSSKNQPKRPVGRPSLNLPPRKRHNLNIERDAEFDANLHTAQRRIAEIRGVEIRNITQTEAVKLAVHFYTEIITINELPKCPRCNGVGHIAINNGDDDVPCPECSSLDTLITGGS